MPLGSKDPSKANPSPDLESRQTFPWNASHALFWVCDVLGEKSSNLVHTTRWKYVPSVHQITALLGASSLKTVLLRGAIVSIK